MALIVGGVTVIKWVRIPVYLCARATNENKRSGDASVVMQGNPALCPPPAGLVTIQSVCVYLLRLE